MQTGLSLQLLEYGIFSTVANPHECQVTMVPSAERVYLGMVLYQRRQPPDSADPVTGQPGAGQGQG